MREKHKLQVDFKLAKYVKNKGIEHMEIFNRCSMVSVKSERKRREQYNENEERI